MNRLQFHKLFSILRSNLFSVLLLIVSTVSIAQSDSYKVEQVPFSKDLFGFSGNCILQDSDGFMWFGSKNGLFRYDGSNFKVFHQIAEDPSSLSFEEVNALLEDRAGVLWIATHHGLNRYDKFSGSFKKFLHIPGDSSSIQLNQIDCLHESKDGCLWIGTINGVSKFDKRKETFKHFNFTVPDTVILFSSKGVDYLLEDKAGTLWIQHGHNGLSKLQPGSDSIEEVTWFHCGLKALFEDRSGRFWITTYCGLYLFDKEKETFTRYLHDPNDPNRLQDDMVRAIMEDRRGHIWIRTYDGIYKYNQQLELLFHWKHRDEYFNIGQDFAITTNIYEDNTGNIWFFNKDGIQKIVKSYQNFHVYDPEPHKNTFVECIIQDSLNNIWMGTLNGLYIYNQQRNYYTHYCFSNQDYMNTATNQNGISEIYRDNFGTYWVAQAEGGLYQIVFSEKNTIEFKRYISKSSGFTNIVPDTIKGFFEDSEGRLWMNSVGQMPCYYDRKKDRLIQLVSNPNSTDQFFGESYIRHETNTNTLLATNHWGIYKIFPPFIEVSEDAVMPSNVLKYKINGENCGPETLHFILWSHMDSSGTFWMSSLTSGLIKLKEKENAGNDQPQLNIRRYTTSHGLPCNYIRGYVEDDKQNLWLGTENGLSKFNKQTEVFTNYYVQHGLPNNGFRNCGLNSVDGELFLGTRNGMISFYPDSFEYNKTVPPVLLTNIFINNHLVVPDDKSILEKQITYTDDIELLYNQNNLLIEFAALNYIEPNLNQYKYKLEGLNEDWILSGNKSSAEYTNLKPGKYIFRAIGSNNDGVWNEEGASLGIFIHPPPWLTWWAYVIYGCILVGILLALRRYVLSREQFRMEIEMEKMEKSKVQELDHMKSRFFANISHEFRTPLTLILGPVEGWMRKKNEEVVIRHNELDIIRRNAKRLQQLINQMLDISKLETGKMKIQVSKGNLDAFVRTIVLSFLSLAERKKINYNYDLPATNEAVFYDEDKVEKILSNLLSNAFKFTDPNGTVSVRFKILPQDGPQKGSQMEIIVRDTGKGILPEQLKHIFDRYYQGNDSDTRDVEGTGIGLALTKELVDLYRGKISVESEPGKGSVFTVCIPVSEEAFTKEEILPEAPGKKTRSASEDRTIEKQDSEHESTEAAQTEEISQREQAKDAPIVLIVEDNIDLRNYISRNLRDSYRIETAENGEEGLQHAIECIPDLVISDVMMPVMDGVEMCSQLKTDERTNHIPVMMLTAKSDMESKLEGLETGADDYMIKPFNTEELQVRVRNLIEQRKKIREKIKKEFASGATIEQELLPQDQVLIRVTDYFTRHIDDHDFKMEDMAAALHMSRSQVFRKVNAVSGSAPHELLRTLRMKKAALLLQSGEKNISQVMYQVGYRSTSHFARAFRQAFGMNPSEFKNQQEQ